MVDDKQGPRLEPRPSSSSLEVLVAFGCVEMVLEVVVVVEVGMVPVVVVVVVVVDVVDVVVMVVTW